MKRTQLNSLPASLLVCLALPLAGPGLADETATAPDTTNWVCRLCPASSGWYGEWDFGVIFVGDPSLKFGDYRGLEEDDGYLDLSGNSSYRGENGAYFDFYGRDLGLDSRALEMRGGKQGSYELRGSYSEIPRYLGYGTETPYLGVGTDTLTLPADWDFRNGEFAGIEDALRPTALDSNRETAGAGLTVRLGSAWKLNADFERQEKDGVRAFSGGTFAISAGAFPAPLDFTTDLFNMGLEYSGNRSQFRFEFAGSDFDNGANSVTWDSPTALGFGDELARSALEPDNEFHQFSLSGAIRFTPNFRISARASAGEMEQDDLFIPYSINPDFDDLVLPRAALNGKVDTSMFNFSGRVFARLANGLDLTLQHKISERDNETPVDDYTQIFMEIFETGERSNKPFGYERSQSKMELRFRPNHKYRLSAGFKRDTRERTLQEVDENEEDSVWGEIQFSPWAPIDFRLKLDKLDRSATEYRNLDTYGSPENPLMRKYNMAERDRERVTAELGWAVSEAFSFTFSYYTTEDDYDRSELGLTGSEETSVNLDVSLAISEKANVYAFFSDDEIESEMRNARNFTANPWSAFARDSVQTWGMGINGRFNDKVSYGLDFTDAASDGEILTDSGAGENPFPVLYTSLRNTRVYLRYEVSDRWGWALDAYREEYKSSDWLIDGLGPDGIEDILILGGTSPDYEVNVFRLSATFKF